MSPRRPRGTGAPGEDPLWQAVTKSVKPLAGKTRKPLPKPEPVPIAPRKLPPKAVAPVHKPAAPIAAPAPRLSARPAALPAIEARLLKTIRRAQTPIDLKLDLHGLRQAEAHRLLERTLTAARLRGQRVILIVTGTGLRRRLAEDSGARVGDEQPGVLRRSLALWLAEPLFQDWVLGFSQAGPEHGGAGAFYLLLRRARPG
jgi:DNA-nicking Smr family endonuclease